MNTKDLINKYLQNELSFEEEKAFNKLLKTDTVFKEEVTFQSNLKKVITHQDDVNFKKLITDIEQDARTKTSKKYSFTKWIAAASIALILGLTYFANQNNTISTNDLFASNFKPYRNVIAPLVRGENQHDKTSKAFLSYEKGEYEKAVLLFSRLYKITKEPYFLFYQANALLKLERANEAVPLLIAHLKTKDSLTQKTNWYLALAYLKLKDTNKAKEALKKVITNKSYKNKDAVKLLQELE